MMGQIDRAESRSKAYARKFDQFATIFNSLGGKPHTRNIYGITKGLPALAEAATINTAGSIFDFVKKKWDEALPVNTVGVTVGAVASGSAFPIAALWATDKLFGLPARLDNFGAKALEAYGNAETAILNSAPIQFGIRMQENLLTRVDAAFHAFFAPPAGNAPTPAPMAA